MQPRRDAEQIQATERAGANAVASLQAIEKADSAAVLTQIREAAEATPGGMEEVLSEMKPGGAYEDLGKEFNAALERDKGFSAAYEKASAALGAYGDQRDKVTPILQNRADSTLARFEALDQEIAKASAAIPAKAAGKSALDETLEDGREALKNAFEAIRNVFGRQGPSAGPSFSR